MNFTASTAQILVVVEALPKCEQGLGAGLGPSVEKNADFRVQDAAKGVEKPTVRVDLFGVFLLEAEDELNGRERVRSVVGWADKLLVGRHRQLRRVFKNVRDRLLSANILLDNLILVQTDGSEHIQHVLVDLFETVKHETDDNFLPRRTTLVPEGRLLEVYNVPNVLHDAMQRTRQEHLVFVVVRDCDQELGVTVVHSGAQAVAILERKVIGIAGGGGISHGGELLLALLGIDVLALHSVLDRAGNGVWNAQDGVLNELDTTGRVALDVCGLLAPRPALVRVGDSGRGTAVAIAIRILGEGVEALLCSVTAILRIGVSRRASCCTRGIGLGKAVGGYGPVRRGSCVVSI